MNRIRFSSTYTRLSLTKTDSEHAVVAEQVGNSKEPMSFVTKNFTDVILPMLTVLVFNIWVQLNVILFYTVPISWVAHTPQKPHLPHFAFCFVLLQFLIPLTICLTVRTIISIIVELKMDELPCDRSATSPRCSRQGSAPFHQRPEWGQAQNLFSFRCNVLVPTSCCQAEFMEH